MLRGAWAGRAREVGYTRSYANESHSVAHPPSFSVKVTETISWEAKLKLYSRKT